MTGRRPQPGGAPRRDPVADDVDAELLFHLETRVDALVAEGRSPEAARAEALREFGDVEDARRAMRFAGRRAAGATKRRRAVSDLRQDLTYALRRLTHAPAFALTAVATLALGIGANAAIFSIVNGVLFRPLPFPEPDRLYAVYSTNRAAALIEAPVSPVDLDDWRARRQSIAEIGGYWHAEGASGVTLTGRGAPRRLEGVFVTPGFFEALGVRPAHGRLPREDQLVRGGEDRVVVLSHAFWVRELGADPDVVGTSLSLGGRPVTILGILPPSMSYPAPHADVFLPYSTIPDSAIPRLRQVRVLNVIARAGAGVPREAVQAEMTSIAGALAATYPEDEAWDDATVRPLAEVISGPARRGLLVLFGAVGLVLLMTCLNVAALQLARAMGRSREVAVRLALGARRGRLVRQLFTESLVLALLGGAAGLVVARVTLDALLALSEGQLPRSDQIALDGAVVAFTAAAAVATALLFGIVPAWLATRDADRASLRESARGLAGQSHHPWRRALIIGEVAVSMVLVVGAGLMSQSFVALTRVDLGFDPDRLLAVQFTLDASRSADDDPGAAGVAPYAMAYRQIIERVRILPGVVSAAAVKDPPFRGNGERVTFRLPDQVVPAGEEPPAATAIHVSDGYFETIGARIVDGREFTSADRPGAPFVIVVNEAFARRYFSDRAVGRSILVGQDVPIGIVGVVNDIRQVAVGEPAQPTIYIHNLQNSRVKTTIVARTAGEPLALADAVQAAVWSIEPAQPITAVFTFDDAVGRALAQPRLLTVLLGGFGGIGLALAALGVYGLVAAAVGERRREFGVRLALGARPRQILADVVRRGVGVAGLGVAVGLAAALALARFMRSVLYGIEPSDPVTYAAMAGVLLAAAAVASWLPAQRAAALDPAETLRAD